MSRLVVTVGIPRDGDAVVLRGPDRDYQAHRDYIQDLRRKLPSGRDEIVVMASGVSNGIAKRIKCDLSALASPSLADGATEEKKATSEGGPTAEPKATTRRKPLPKG